MREKNRCDQICHLQTSLDSLTEQMGSLQSGDHCIPKQIRLSHNFKIIVTGRKHIIAGNRKNRSLGHYAHFGLHGLAAWTPQSPNSTAQYANVFLYVIVLLIQSEERERAHVHDMSTIWGFRAHGLHARGTRTPKPTRQRSESMGMMFDMQKNSHLPIAMRENIDVTKPWGPAHPNPPVRGRSPWG